MLMIDTEFEVYDPSPSSKYDAGDGWMRTWVTGVRSLQRTD